MSYRGNGGDGYYSKNNAGFQSQNNRYDPGRSGSNNGDMKHAGGQSRNAQLFMGDLEPHWDESTIQEIWKNLGESNVDIKMMWNNRNGRRTRMGFCFVQFSSQAHASNALLKNGVPIPNHSGKTLRLNWSSSSYNNNSSQESGEISIFVGDLAPNVTESDLFEVFIGKYASTSHVKVVYDQATGVSKGFAFVKFTNRDDQQRALQEMTGTFLKGRAIRVGNAGHQSQRNRGGATIDNKARNYNGPGAGPKHPKGSTISTSQFMFPTQQIPPLNDFTDPNNTTLFVKGLSPSITDHEFKATLQPFGQIVYVRLFVEKRSGIVQYVDRKSAEAAMNKLQRFRIKESKISLWWGRPARQLHDKTPYQAQPSLSQPTYGYIPLPSNETTSGGRSSDSIKENELLLLPGLSAFHEVQFPAPASGIQQTFEWKPGSDALPQPRVLVRSSDTFAQELQASLERIEDASNGYIYA